MIDIGWEGIPNWIVAATSILTLGAAVTAGVFAGRAAHWTKAQSIATAEQVAVADEAVVIAREDAATAQATSELQRAEAERAARRYAESRLDGLAPTIYARATPGSASGPVDAIQQHRPATDSRREEWDAVERPLKMASDSRIAFRTLVLVSLQNVSDRIAVIDIFDPVGGGVDGLRAGESFVLPPGKTRQLQWRRNVSTGALSDEVALGKPEHSLFDLTFWVRDLGMNVRDVYRFNGDLRYFARDGSTITINPRLAYAWEENVALQLPGRVYERLDAESL
jgi:hypothetical protein